MTKLLLILMVVGLWSGCGKEIEVVKKTQPITGKLIEEYEVYRDENSNKPIKHGYYKSYYEDKSYEEIGQYEDDKKDGEWVVYDESGEVEWEGNYVDGKFEGKKVWYDEEGNITDEDMYKDGECVEMCEGNE